MQALDEQWRRSCAGEPRLVRIRGPAGIGKTSVLGRFLAEVDPPAVLRATGDELESGLAFGVLEQLTGRSWPHLAELAGDHDPLAAGAALVRLLGDRQGAAPLAVVVDDAHWADTLSLQALAFAFRRLEAERVLCLVVHRDEDVPLPDSLERAVASERGSSLDLAGLGVDELIALGCRLGLPPMARRVAVRLAEHTGGNPLHATAFLRELGPDALQDMAGVVPAPQLFSLTALARVAACSSETQSVVTAAAVLGQRCRLAHAATLADVEQPLDALEEAMQAQLLAPVDTPVDLVAFSHPLVRAAIYHDLGPAQRSALHDRAASLLEGGAALDHRAAATVGHDRHLAKALIVRARTEAQGGAWSAAAAHLERAAQAEPDAAERDRLVLESVELLLRGGEIAAAVARLPRVMALPPSAAKQAVLGHAALLTGRQQEAERALAAAWHAGTDRELGAGAAAQLSQLLLAQARGAEAALWASRAMDGSADPFTRGVAVSVLVAALAVQGRGEEGLALVADLPVGVSDLTAEETEGVMARGVVSLWSGDLSTARTDLGSVVSLHGSWRPIRVRAISLGHLAVAEFFLGSWDDSVAHADLGVSLAADSDYVFIAPLMHYGATMALAGRGQWNAAHAHAAAAAAASERLGDASGVGYAGTAAAWTAYCQGRPTQVLEGLRALRGLRQPDGIHEPGVLHWQGLHVEALVALDRLDEARAALEPFARTTAQRGHPLATADAERARGHLEAAAGDRAAAFAAFERAADALDGVPAPFERARLDLAHGRLLRRHGQRRRAVEKLQAAREVHTDLGAEPFVASCHLELEACGLEPSRRGSDEPVRLTPRELAVARLVAAGMTNREAARELVVSEKTVEYHLGNAYAKLGLRSRTQLAAHLGQD